MKYKAKLFGPYLPIFALIFAATVSMRCIALFLQFNFSTGYYTEKTLINISDYLTAAAVIFFLSYIFTAKRDIKLIPDFSSPATYIPTGIVSAATVFLTIELFKRAKVLYALLNSRTQILLLAVILLTAVLSVLSIAHFVLTSVIESHTSTKRATYGLCTVLFLSMYVIYLYFSSEILFEKHLPINAPNKIVDQMAYLAAAVFFLYETRLSINREKWRTYIAFGFASALLCAYSAIPSVIIYFSTGNVISNSIYESALTLALFIFIISRLLLTGFLIDGSKSRTVSSIIAFATARDNQINPAAPAVTVTDIPGELTDADANQITIDDLTKELDSNEESAASESTAEESMSEISIAEQSEPDDASETEVPEIPTAPEEAQ